jgi:hypothetical protein
MSSHDCGKEPNATALKLHGKYGVSKIWHRFASEKNSVQEGCKIPSVQPRS